MISMTAISYAFRDRGTLAAIDAMAEIGFENVELWRGHSDGVAEALTKENVTEAARSLKREIKARGLRVSSYCIGGVTDESPKQLRTWGQFALELGTNILTGCLLRPGRAAEIDAVFRPLGILYGMENHKGIHFEGIEPYEEIFAGDRYPSLGINVDTGHFVLAGVDVPEALRRLAGRIVHVHLKDVPSPGNHRYEHSCPLGEGRLDVPLVVRTLQEVGYSGPVSIEYEDQNPEKALRESLVFLTGVMKDQQGAQSGYKGETE